jgi:hypothetical protein
MQDKAMQHSLSFSQCLLMEVQSHNTPLYRKQCACAIKVTPRTAPNKK